MKRNYAITQEYTYAARTTNGLLRAVSFALPCKVGLMLQGLMPKGQQKCTGHEEEPGNTAQDVQF